MARPRLARSIVIAAACASGTLMVAGSPAFAAGVGVSVSGNASIDLTVPGLPPVNLPPIPKLPTLPTVPGPSLPRTTPTLPAAPSLPSAPTTGTTPALPILAPTPVKSTDGPAAGYAVGPERYGEKVVRDVPITMRDGVVLRGDIHEPTDLATGQPAPGPFPVILSETPYGKQVGEFGGTTAELTGYEPALIKRGYIQLIVDVRGSGGSEGNFDLLSPTEQRDSVQVIDYASKLPNATGKVGMLGLSYVGITQLLAAENVGPGSPLKAIMPIMATNDPYRELASDGGLLNLASTPAYAELVNGLATVNPLAQIPRAPVYGALLTGSHGIGSTYWSAGTLGKALLGQDEAYDQSYWRARSPGAHLDQIVKNGVAAFLIGGSYDVFQSGEVLNFVGLQNAAARQATTGPLQTTQPLSSAYQLLVGPWYHQAHFDQFDLQQTELAWFDHWLKGIDTGITDTAQPLHVIEPGGKRYDSASIPASNATATKLYLGKTVLRPAPPTGKHGADPIAWSGASVACNRSSEQWFTGLPNQFLNALGLQDPCAANRPATPDSPIQRSYTTATVASDTRISGPGTLTLAATATTTDTEFIATVQDVDPNGDVVDLTGGSLLGSHRVVDPSLSWLGAGGDPLLTWHPYTKATKQAVAPGKITRYDVPLRPVFATLPAGHRLRVVITTSELPHVIAIPEDLKNLVGGVYAIQRNQTAASFLQLPLGPSD